MGAMAKSDATPTPEENKPATPIGLRGNQDDPKSYDPKQNPPANADLVYGNPEAVKSKEYLKPDSTAPAPV